MNTRKSNRDGVASKPPMKTHYDPGPGKPLWQMALLALALCHLFLIPMSLFILNEASGPLESFKLILVGVGASAAAYVVNRFSIERLAPLHALNFRLAGAFAIFIITATGSGMFLGSLSAMILKPVESRVYQEAGNDAEAFISVVHETALVAARVTPSVLAVSDDIERTVACEVASSCLSGRGNGGRGPMTVALEAAQGQAFAIAEALEAGAVERAQYLDALNRLYRDYTETLADTNRSLSDRRVELQAIYAELRQVAAALREALPIALVEGFVRDLRSGASIAGDPVGTATLNAYLRDHAATLDEALDRLPEVELEAPSFPPRPGMLDIVDYLAEFAAIAGIVFVAELCLPITLYVMTWLKLYWLRVREEDDPIDPSEPDQFDGLIDLDDPDGDRHG